MSEKVQFNRIAEIEEKQGRQKSWLPAELGVTLKTFKQWRDNIKQPKTVYQKEISRLLDVPESEIFFEQAVTPVGFND